jgi:hypothetical protein
MTDRVLKAKELLAAARSYPRGCSEFVCAVLGIAWQDANSLMGAIPTPAGDNNNYQGMRPGDVAGWKVLGGSGHVAIYVGEPGQKFIDVQTEGHTPRSVGKGYGMGRPVFKSSSF